MSKSHAHRNNSSLDPDLLGRFQVCQAVDSRFVIRASISQNSFGAVGDTVSDTDRTKSRNGAGQPRFPGLPRRARLQVSHGTAAQIPDER